MSTTVRRIQIIEEEIEVLRGQVQEYDTGHIITAIGVLEKRVRDLEQEELGYQKTRNKTYAETND
jgi:hypothetical protein